MSNINPLTQGALSSSRNPSIRFGFGTGSGSSVSKFGEGVKLDSGICSLDGRNSGCWCGGRTATRHGLLIKISPRM